LLRKTPRGDPARERVPNKKLQRTNGGRNTLTSPENGGRNKAATGEVVHERALCATTVDYPATTPPTVLRSETMKGTGFVKLFHSKRRPYFAISVDRQSTPFRIAQRGIGGIGPTYRTRPVLSATKRDTWPRRARKTRPASTSTAVLVESVGRNNTWHRIVPKGGRRKATRKRRKLGTTSKSFSMTYCGSRRTLAAPCPIQNEKLRKKERRNLPRSNRRKRDASSIFEDQFAFHFVQRFEAAKIEIF